MRVILRFGTLEMEADVGAIPEDDIVWICPPGCFSFMPWKDAGEKTASGTRVLEYAL